MGYIRISGNGPIVGWVSIKLNGKILVKKTNLTLIQEQLMLEKQEIMFKRHVPKIMISSELTQVSTMDKASFHFVTCHQIGHPADWWHDHLRINKSGRFRRLATCDGGHWSVQGKTFTLHWDARCSDVLFTRNAGITFDTLYMHFTLASMLLPPSWFLNLFLEPLKEYALEQAEHALMDATKEKNIEMLQATISKAHKVGVANDSVIEARKRFQALTWETQESHIETLATSIDRAIEVNASEELVR